MGYQQGLSGLSVASNTLDVTGNNIANASTVGFKQGQAQFADMYATSLAQQSGTGVGIGARLSTVAQQFGQGNITQTGQPLDVAINGGGFFRMSGPSGIEYTRNGQFQLNSQGYIVNAQGVQLTGYGVGPNGTVNGGMISPLQIPTANIQPKVSGKITAQFNLDSREATPVNSPFSPTDPQSYNNSTSVTVFDTLGNPANVSMYFVKSATLNAWNVYATSGANNALIPSQSNNAVTGLPQPGLIGSATFTPSGVLSAFTPSNPTAVPNGQAVFTIPTTSGATPTQSLTLDLGTTTQFGNSYDVNQLSQDGYTSGTLTGFNIGADGMVNGQYSNGASQSLGQVALVNFNNPNGLQAVGNNAWSQTSLSGSPLVGAPGGTNLGTLESGAVESSNVDLTTELVGLITAQRNYQANAQTIKTQNTVDQTLINL